MAISDEQAREWAEHFIRAANDFYEFSDVYEDEDFTEDYPDEDDWKTVFDLMVTANVTVDWNNKEETNGND